MFFMTARFPTGSASGVAASSVVEWHASAVLLLPQTKMCMWYRVCAQVMLMNGNISIA